MGIRKLVDFLGPGSSCLPLVYVRLQRQNHGKNIAFCYHADSIQSGGPKKKKWQDLEVVVVDVFALLLLCHTFWEKC